MSNDQKPNGRVSTLLWLNTILTALLIPTFGLGVSRVMAQMDKTADKVQTASEELVIVKDRQGRVLNDLLPQMQRDMEGLKNRLETHMRRSEGKTNP